jgi:hypothetical protein
MQGDAFNAFNEILRRPLFEELSASHSLRPLLRVTTMLYSRPSTLYDYDSSNVDGRAMRIPSARGVHQGCVLGAKFFAIVTSHVCKHLAAIVPNASCSGQSGHAVVLTMVSSWDPVRRSWLLATLCRRRMLESASRYSSAKTGCIPLRVSVTLSITYPKADNVEAASSSVGMPPSATALLTRAMGRKRPRASSSGT